MVREHGIKTAIITGENRALNAWRATKLHVDFLKMGITEKLPVLKELCLELRISLEEVLYIGDDVNDVECIVQAGIGVAVANAEEVVKQQADSVSGFLTVLLCGKKGEAYNIADEKSDSMLKELATVIADYVSTKVVFELPDIVESAGYSKATKVRLASRKLKKLGWKAIYDINKGIENTIEILKEIQ